MKRTPLARRSRLRPVSKKQVTVAALNKLARHLVVVLRDEGACQRCGTSSHDAWHRNRAGKMEPGPPQIHWAHIRAGRAKSLAHQPWAAMALCAGCHFWFDANGNGKPGSASREWWAAQFPDRDILLRHWEHQDRHPCWAPAITKAFLEQEIAKFGVAVPEPK